jgi:DNA (cytosine-5)-methyltransferase 1
MNYLIADLFCGAGGSSEGAERAIQALGHTMTLVCINHWPVAIETHRRNHPTARHYIEDITVADPHKLVPEGRLDLLMASPECTFYSRARGGKPVNDQSRMNPWAIQRWLTSLDVKCLLVENVPEFISWGPLLPSGIPDPDHKGLYFQAWIKALWELGYQVDWRKLNAADYGDATTRVRFFLIARKDGQSVRWPEPTHSPDGAADMLEPRKRWRAAREIIEWGNPGRSLLDDPKYKRKPLAEKTRRRIARGLERFGGPLAPLYINLLGLEPTENAGDQPQPEPFIMGKQGHSPAYRSADQPIPTVTAEGKSVLVNATIEPFVLGQQSCGAPRSTGEPIPTVAGAGAISLVQAVVIGQHRGVVRGVDKPIPTCATHGGISVISPLMVKYFGTGVCHLTEDPVPTITTKDRIGLVNSTIIPFRGERDGQDPRVHSIDEPIPTITAEPGFALAAPAIIPYYGDHKGKREPRAHSIEEPIRTITCDPRFGLANPILVEVNNDGGQSLVEPTLTRVEGRDVDPRRLVQIDGEMYLLDIRFRMLTNLELARAMGFSDNESQYEFVGKSAEVTRQIGNAVAVNMAKALVTAILEGR